MGTLPKRAVPEKEAGKGSDVFLCVYAGSSVASSLHFSLTRIMLSVSVTCLSCQGSCVCRTKVRFEAITQIILGAGN